jgi:hypothetical protein
LDSLLEDFNKLMAEFELEVEKKFRGTTYTFDSYFAGRFTQVEHVRPGLLAP